MAADKDPLNQEIDSLIRAVLRKIATGSRPGPMLGRLLLDALENPDRRDRPVDPSALVSDSARAATEWIGVSPEDREKAIRELLLLADALRPNPSREISLVDKVTAVHRRLDEKEVPHAIGGALAVGYYGVPRSTLDIDVNLFIELETAGETAEELRVAWDPNSLHFFFSSDPLHDQMRRRIRHVPFNDGEIPLVAPEHLVIRKALLDRTKDWLDIEQILVATDPLDIEEIEDWLERTVGRDNPRMAKLAEVKSSLSLD